MGIAYCADKEERWYNEVCIDYHWLNDVTQVETYPMRGIDDIIDLLGKVRFISTLDLTRGYWQMPVATEDRAKTAFVTPKDLYQFKIMPFWTKWCSSVIPAVDRHVGKGRGQLNYKDLGGQKATHGYFWVAILMNWSALYYNNLKSLLLKITIKSVSHKLLQYTR